LRIEIITTAFSPSERKVLHWNALPSERCAKNQQGGALPGPRARSEKQLFTGGIPALELKVFRKVPINTPL
jgi:hypothetical protein